MWCRCWWTPCTHMCSPRRGSPCPASSARTGAPPPTWCPMSTRYRVPWCPHPLHFSPHSPLTRCSHGWDSPSALTSGNKCPTSQRKPPLLGNPPQHPSAEAAAAPRWVFASRTRVRAGSGLGAAAGVGPGPAARTGAACAAAARVLRPPHAGILRAPLPARPGPARAPAGGRTPARLPGCRQ